MFTDNSVKIIDYFDKSLNVFMTNVLRNVIDNFRFDFLSLSTLYDIYIGILFFIRLNH